jgi:hypothetical protein
MVESREGEAIKSREAFHLHAFVLQPTERLNKQKINLATKVIHVRANFHCRRFSPSLAFSPTSIFRDKKGEKFPAREMFEK